MINKICLVRPPALPAYQDTDIKEDPMLTMLIGYLCKVGVPLKNIDIFDYQLSRSITYKDLLEQEYEHYVIAARDLGESYRYSLRTARNLSADTSAKIWIYGQVAPLRYMGALPPRVEIVIQSEHVIAEKMGLDKSGPTFKKDLCGFSYFNLINLEPWQLLRKKGAIETTRGCPYKCKFCFITAGQNYEKRWLARPNDAIMADLKSYTDQGIHRFVFLDSEFLGKNPAYHHQKRELLNKIINELPPINYMILCRADTILAFDEFDLLQRSGMKKILLGVESLYQPDLDALKKDSTVPLMMEAITQLIEHNVECCLTYLTFHRNTTIAGLRENLANIKTLYQHPKSRYLGMPNFSFNMEVIRGDFDEAQTGSLSDVTYIKPLLKSRGQADSDPACFPTYMEPLIEIYRLLQYEWVVKKCELIKSKQTLDDKSKEQINNWFNGLGLFCIKQMELYLDSFEANQLNFNSLLKEKGKLFDAYLNYNKLLPQGLRSLATYDGHAAQINYQDSLQMENHGWDAVIPESKVELEAVEA